MTNERQVKKIEITVKTTYTDGSYATEKSVFSGEGDPKFKKFKEKYGQFLAKDDQPNE